MTNTQQDLGTWTWTWTSGPLVGTSHCLISNKCELRPHDQLDGPIISLWQTPSGFVCQIAGGELEVNGVVSDIHLLKQGDMIHCPGFSARLQYVFAGQQDEPVPNDLCDVETMDACFLDPSTFQAAPRKQLSEQSSEVRKKLLIAFRGLRKIKHKISSVPSGCANQLIDSIDDISARIDQATSMIEQLITEPVASKPAFTGCDSECGCCSADCAPTGCTAQDCHTVEPPASENCAVECYPAFDSEQIIESVAMETPQSLATREEPCGDWQNELTVEFQPSWEQARNSECESPCEFACENPSEDIAADHIPTSSMELMPTTESSTEEYCTELLQDTPEHTNPLLAELQKFLYLESDSSITPPLTENPAVSLEMVTTCDTGESEEDNERTADLEISFVESDCQTTTEANLAQDFQISDLNPVNIEPPSHGICVSEVEKSIESEQEPSLPIDSSYASENVQPKSFESLTNSKFEVPPHSNMTMVVGDIQELIEHARRKAALRIAETQGISEEQAIEPSVMNGDTQEIANAVNSLDGDDTCPDSTTTNDDAELVSKLPAELVATTELDAATELGPTQEIAIDAFAMPAWPTASDVAEFPPAESWVNALSSDGTPIGEESASENSSEETIGDVYADAAHVFVPLREMSVTSQIRFHEVLNRLNAESVDMSEITENKAAPSISDNELLGLNSFDLTIDNNDSGETPDYLKTINRDNGADDLLSMTAEQWLNQQFNQPTPEEPEEPKSIDPPALIEIPSLDLQINRKFEEIETELSNIDNVVELPKLTSADQQELSDPNALSDETKSEIGSLRSRLRELLGTYSREELAALPEAVVTAGPETDFSNPEPHQADMNLQSEEQLMSTPNNSLTPESNLASAAFMTQFNEQNETPVAPEPAPRPIEAPTARSNHEDESVDDYMSKLFNRLRGTEPERTAPPKPAPAATEQTDAPVIQNEQTAVVSEPPLKADEFLPKKQAPERNANMNVLRQLANESTRMAVTQFEVTQQKSMSSTRIACFGGATGFALVFFALSKQLGDLTSLAGLGSAAVAVGVGVWHLLAMRNSSPEKV
jgi:hypothetical protein